MCVNEASGKLDHMVIKIVLLPAGWLAHHHQHQRLNCFASFLMLELYMFKGLLGVFWPLASGIDVRVRMSCLCAYANQAALLLLLRLLGN